MYVVILVRDARTAGRMVCSRVVHARSGELCDAESKTIMTSQRVNDPGRVPERLYATQ